MKKLSTLLLSGLMFVSLVGCGPSDNGGNGGNTADGTYNGPTELTEPTSREVQSLDYVTTALATDHEINANLVDGLLENDSTGKLVPALAESYEHNEDYTVWTFHLKKGVKWVTNQGEEYGEVTAHDFVAGLRHGVEFVSGTGYLLEGVVKGYSEYKKSDFSDEAFAEVGVKALDDYTLEYTLEKGVPYFDSMTTYAVLYPVNQTFLESKGAGCKLGAPNKENCAYGTALPDSILYNGGYLLSVNDAKSKTVLIKNESYWDAEHVYLETVTRIYDAGEDPYSSINGFEQGTYAEAALNPGWADYDTYAEKYKNNAFEDIPNSSVFGLVFNFNRQTYEHTAHTSEADKENTRNAILNDNFRKALRASYDTIAENATAAPENVAKSMQRNINNVPEIVSDSQGNKYIDLVEKSYIEATGENVDLSDGQNPWLSKENALAYIEAAKAEGITFPVSLDMLVTETSDKLVKQGQSLKQSIEANTDGQIIINLILEDEDTVKNIAYYNQDPALSDYDISTFTGWSPDFVDPKSFVDIYSPTTGYYMTSCGLQLPDENGNVTDAAIKEQIGLFKYEEMYRTADAITDDLDARYAAFAKADAYLVERVFFIPARQQQRFFRVSKKVPFTKPYSVAGISEYKYKGLQLQDEIVTVDQYNVAYQAWQDARK